MTTKIFHDHNWGIEVLLKISMELNFMICVKRNSIFIQFVFFLA